MTVRFRKSVLQSFLDDALSANISYFVVRRNLLNKFSSARLRHSQNVSADELVRIPRDLFVSVVSILSARNDSLPNDARLAFPNHVLDMDTIVNGWDEEIPEMAAEYEDDHEEVNQQPPNPPPPVRQEMKAQNPEVKQE